MSQCIVECKDNFGTSIYTEDRSIVIQTDAPKEHGGKGVQFSPTDLVAAALGACIITVMSMHAKKIGIDFQEAKAKVTKNQKATVGGIGELIVHVYYPHKLEKSVEEKLEKATTHCPVHQVIDPKVRQEIIFHWGEILS